MKLGIACRESPCDRLWEQSENEAFSSNDLCYLEGSEAALNDSQSQGKEEEDE
jgi:hypothetical protein